MKFLIKNKIVGDKYVRLGKDSLYLNEISQVKGFFPESISIGQQPNLNSVNASPFIP